MKRVAFHEEADAEVFEAACYYEERSEGLGLSFLVDVEEAGKAKDATAPAPFELMRQIHARSEGP